MNYSLGKEDLDLFIDNFFKEKIINDQLGEELKLRIESCLNWEDSVGILLYIFTHFLQKKSKKDISMSECIEDMFNLSEMGSFILETLDRNFIDYMLSYNRSKINEELSETLVMINQNYLDRTYDSAFCF